MLSGESFSDDKNKADTLLQDFSLFCYFACWKKTSNMSKSTYFIGQQVYSQVIKLLDKAKIQQRNVSFNHLSNSSFARANFYREVGA